MNFRLTKNYAPYRLFGYATSLALHGGNSIVMFLALRGDVMKDPEIKTFAALQWAYVTIWNVVSNISVRCNVIFIYSKGICILNSIAKLTC